MERLSLREARMKEAVKSKSFTLLVDDKEVTLYFKRPNQDDLFEIDKTYRKIYSAAILDGIMTEVQARRIHAKSGAWTEEHDKEIREIAQTISKLEVVLRSCDPKDSESLQLAANMNTLRAQMMTRIGDKQDLFNNTAEGIALEQKMHTFIQRCCRVDGSNELYFKTKDDYKEFVSEYADEMGEIHKEAYFYEYRLPEDIAKDWAEIEFIDRLNDEIKEIKAAESAEKAAKEGAKTRKRMAKKKTAKKKTARKKTTKKKTKRTAAK